MLDHDQVTPEETEEHNQPLIRDLQRYYTTHAEDQASLEHIRAQLLRKKAASAPAADASLTLPEPTPTARTAGIAFVPTFTLERPHRPYLTTLVAAVLLVALIGSFTLALHLRQEVAVTPPTLHIAHDWSLVENLRGTGPMTVTGKNIDVGHKYGWLLTCANTLSGPVSVTFNGANEGISQSACDSKDNGAPLAPNTVFNSPVPLAPIQSIKITTDASTSWEFFLFVGAYYPPLTIDTGWQPLMSELDGTGNETAVGVNVTLPQVWGLLFVCHGTGTIQVSLQSGPAFSTPEVTGTTAPCDGHPNFDTSENISVGTHITQIQVTTGNENDWQVVLVSTQPNLSS